MLRRLAIARCEPSPSARFVSFKHASLKDNVKEHGLPAAVYYVLANQVLILALTYLLHAGYFGQEDLIGFLEKIGASKYVNLEAVEKKSWSFLGGKVVISARLVANYTAASVFVVPFAPIKLPLILGTYPAMRRTLERMGLFGRRKKVTPTESPPPKDHSLP